MVMFTPQTIKELRTSLRLSMREMAKLANVTVGTVSLWESGKRHPRYKAMERLNALAEREKSGR